ncbi:MAG: alanine racemase [Pseudomonadota bacterium]
MRENLAVARRHAAAPGSASARIWAVVKANGYGHGLRHALSGFEQADGLALVEFEMAARLRSWGWTGPILMLEGAFDPADVAQALEQGLSLAMHDEAQLRWLESCTGGVRPGMLDVWLKCNTGMNRLGFAPSAVAGIHARLRALPVVRGVGLMTHFANADLLGGADAAIEAFRRATEGLAGERSLANSAALIDLPGTRADWARPGVMLYGGSPFATRSARSLGLRAAMTLRSRLIAIQRLSPGDAVGYGSIFRAQAPMRIGVVACGYADGYPRHAPNGTPVLVDGIRTRTVGRVAMDMLMVDLGPVPSAVVGAEVELWGERLPIDDVAASAGTIGYELMCALAPRVPIEVSD